MSKREHGRPTVYTREIADEICERLASGETLRSICRTEGFPPTPTVRRWVLENRDGFSERYREARELGYEEIAEEMREISDTVALGDIVTDKPNGVETRTQDMTQHRQLQINTRQWILARMCPKKFGDRQILSGDEDSPLEVTLSTRLLAARKRAKLGDG